VWSLQITEQVGVGVLRPLEKFSTGALFPPAFAVGGGVRGGGGAKGGGGGGKGEKGAVEEGGGWGGWAGGRPSTLQLGRRQLSLRWGRSLIMMYDEAQEPARVARRARRMAEQQESRPVPTAEEWDKMMQVRGVLYCTCIVLYFTVLISPPGRAAGEPARAHSRRVGPDDAGEEGCAVPYRTQENLLLLAAEGWGRSLQAGIRGV